MSWAALKPWLVMALIFGAGMVAGAALLTAVRAGHPHPPPGMRQLHNRWLMHLTHRLDLTPDQQTKVDAILADADGQIEKLHRDEIEKLSGIMDQANARIAPLLTPPQQEQLKQLQRERDRTFSGHLGPWKGPHGDGGPPQGPPPQDGPPPAPGGAPPAAPPAGQ